MDNIIEYPNTLNGMLCDDIIERYEGLEMNKPFIIPKKVEWMKIESVLYKELLTKINDYKNKLIQNSNSEVNIKLLKLLNTNLFIKDFVIYKYSPSNQCKSYFRQNSRHNVLSFIFYLNTIEKGGETVFDIKTIKASKGTLLIFPDSIHYKPGLPQELQNQFIISGQLSNIITI